MRLGHIVERPRLQRVQVQEKSPTAEGHRSGHGRRWLWRRRSWLRDEEKRRARERKKQERGIGRVPNRGAQLQRCAGCVQPGMSASSAPPAASAIVADASSCVLAEARA